MVHSVLGVICLGYLCMLCCILRFSLPCTWDSFGVLMVNSFLNSNVYSLAATIVAESTIQANLLYIGYHWSLQGRPFRSPWQMLFVCLSVTVECTAEPAMLISRAFWNLGWVFEFKFDHAIIYLFFCCITTLCYRCSSIVTTKHSYENTTINFTINAQCPSVNVIYISDSHCIAYIPRDMFIFLCK